MPEVGDGEVRGTCAGQVPGPFMHEKGEVSYVAAFPGTFVTHTEEDARKNADTFRHLRTIAIYRIEIVDIVPMPTPEAPAPEGDGREHA